MNNPVYLTSTKAYPIAYSEQDVMPLLRDPFCRAVVLRDPDFVFDAKEIQALRLEDLAQKYWEDATAPSGRLRSGETTHTSLLTVDDIRSESRVAGIVISETALSLFTERCNQIRALFGRVFEEYTGLRNTVLRGFTLFTPVGGRGRAPELHIDNTILSVHWSAALSTFRVCDGDIPDDIWDVLDPDTRKNYFHFLVDALKRHDLQTVENEIGDIMITKGQKGLDLSSRDVRQAVCVHASSDTIIQNGQAGFLMTPQMS
ncbi:MAG: hypothetical protein JNL76_01930 [Alphaproteobacteria bacterium]|nr:hypothetical protein [Alphaproteobacteria bacterium]